MFWFEDAHDNDELCEGVNTLGDMMQKIYVKEASLTEFEVDWKSAAVRPVKHAVDGTYYMKLLAQRRKDAKRKEAGVKTVVMPVERIESFEEYLEEAIAEAGITAARHDGASWPVEGAEFAMI